MSLGLVHLVVDFSEVNQSQLQQQQHGEQQREEQLREEQQLEEPHLMSAQLGPRQQLALGRRAGKVQKEAKEEKVIISDIILVGSFQLPVTPVNLNKLIQIIIFSAKNYFLAGGKVDCPPGKNIKRCRDLEAQKKKQHDSPSSSIFEQQMAAPIMESPVKDRNLGATGAQFDNFIMDFLSPFLIEEKTTPRTTTTTQPPTTKKTSFGGSLQSFTGIGAPDNPTVSILARSSILNASFFRAESAESTLNPQSMPRSVPELDLETIVDGTFT